MSDSPASWAAESAATLGTLSSACRSAATSALCRADRAKTRIWDSARTAPTRPSREASGRASTSAAAPIPAAVRSAVTVAPFRQASGTPVPGCSTVTTACTVGSPRPALPGTCRPNLHVTPVLPRIAPVCAKVSESSAGSRDEVTPEAVTVPSATAAKAARWESMAARGDSTDRISVSLRTSRLIAGATAGELSRDPGQEGPGPRLLRVGQHLGRGAGLDDVAVVHEDDSVGHLPGEAHLV